MLVDEDGKQLIYTIAGTPSSCWETYRYADYNLGNYPNAEFLPLSAEAKSDRELFCKRIRIVEVAEDDAKLYMLIDKNREMQFFTLATNRDRTWILIVKLLDGILHDRFVSAGSCDADPPQTLQEYHADTIRLYEEMENPHKYYDCIPVKIEIKD